MNFTFAEFFMIWAERMQWKVPQVHLDIIEFLESEDWGDNFAKVLLVWRSLGKSTIVDLWVAYKLTQDPSLRFLIISESWEIAKKSTKDILSIIKMHPLAKHLYDKQLEVKQNLFYVKGNNDPRSPSVCAYGVSSSVTGSRADIVIYDDSEAGKNSGTPHKREDLRRKVSETARLLVPEGKRLFVGTYHDHESIYDEQYEAGANKLRIPLMNNPKGEFPYIKGVSNWPERFDEETILQYQKSSVNKSNFYSQYMLIATSVEDSDLDPKLIKVYDAEVEFLSSNGSHTARIGEIILQSVTAFWDPALSGARRDDSVLAIVFTDSKGNYYIHRTLKLEGTADEQCAQIKRHVLRYHIPLVSVETNGIGAMLPDILIKHLDGTGIGVNGVYSTMRKNDKILQGFETALYSGMLYAHQLVMDGELPSQLRDFDYGNTRQRDDYNDATASAILTEPVRVASFIPSGNIIVNQWGGDKSVQMERYQFQL